MKLIIQRVNHAEVEVSGEVIGRCGHGLLIYIGVGVGDDITNARWLAEKAANLRIFEDAAGQMNRSALDIGGEALVVTNFTLMADARKGRRPSFIAAMNPQQAEELSDSFVSLLRDQGLKVETGRFRADMKVRSEAVGPVNIIVDHPIAQ